MKALMCHNEYRHQGGEDVVFADECWLLEQYGHEVIRYTKYNQELDKLTKLELVRNTFFNDQTYREIREIIQAQAPDVVHCANPFPLLSPALYQAAKDEGVPMVQTLHNFRLTCPGSTLMRNGKICENCLGKPFALSGIIHRCYRDSVSASAVSAIMHAYRRARGSWTELVDQYIVLTDHSRQKFIQAGLPADRLTTKPNFVRPDPGFHDPQSRQPYAVFVGRLSREKGIEILLQAWKTLGQRLGLVIVGDGPYRALVQQHAARNPGIQFLGQQSQDEAIRQIAAAKMLVFPSIWYETFGRSLVEAKACGTPVVASNMGAMAELIQHGHTGLLFEPGNAQDLVAQCSALLDDPALRMSISSAARQDFEQHFTAERNLAQLLAIYGKAGVALAKRSDQPSLPPVAEINQ